ncbi:MAG: mRNA surveillance protein pelota [Candidatus Iainarchaeum archaeon]|uniref:mRNA surveillance protein pelota n=1 Tax=Candidatus Iainarchaeum sp. TaxID=3101447 RepID=A0A7T9DJX2_9ARCH|nr:MAG: mRNA surveillance protein pelota [Candidatus Diapherotrites archaeon]
MRIMGLNAFEHFFQVECHSAEDFHNLAKLIHPNDLVSGETDRNIKPREPGQKPFRLKMHLTLSVISIEVDDHLPALRVNGRIERGTPEEFVEVKSQHTLQFNLFQPIRVQKTQLAAHEVEQLKQFEAESKKPLSLCVVLDDEEALLVQISGSGVKEIAHFSSFKSGKQFKSDSTQEKFFSKLSEIIYSSPVNQIIIAGPGFTREALLSHMEEIKPKGSEKQFLSIATSDIGMKGVKEALSAPLITKAIGEYKLAQESDLMHELLKELGKNSGLGIYGIAEVEKAIQLGAAHTLMLSSGFQKDFQEKSKELLHHAAQNGVKSFILEEKNEPGKQLAGLGGVAALLRYRIEYH